MNLLGFVKTKRTQPSLYANKQGFISIYALMIVSVFLLFSSFVIQRAYTYASLRNQGAFSYLLDIYIAKEVKHHIAENQAQKDQEVQEEEIEEISNEGVEEVVKTTWNATYQGTTVQFVQEDFNIHVTYVYQSMSKEIQITLDEQTMELMNFAYVS